MTRIHNWLGSSAVLSAWRDPRAIRPNGFARMIDERPVSITVVRDGSAKTAQPVRIEPLSAGSAERMGIVIEGANSAVLVLGYKNHETITDTDLIRGDWFYYDNKRYDVKQTLAGVDDALFAIAEASDYAV